MVEVSEAPRGKPWGIKAESSEAIAIPPRGKPRGFLAKEGEKIEICKDIYSTGELGITIKEQSLVIKTEKGLVVITGCAHPGILEIVRNARESFGEEIYLVFGGFHLLSYSSKGINEIIQAFRDLGVIKAGPCHCSGGTAKNLFTEEYAEDFVSIGVGKVIEIK